MAMLSETADIQVHKVANDNPVYMGQKITYSIDIFNAGPADAENVLLEESVPLGLSNLEMSVDGGLNWQAFMTPANIVGLKNGERLTVLIRATVEPTDQVYITTVTSVSSHTPDSNIKNNTSVVRITVNKSQPPNEPQEADEA